MAPSMVPLRGRRGPRPRDRSSPRGPVPGRLTGHEPARGRRPDRLPSTRRRPRSSSPRRRSGCCTCACCSAARSARRSSGPPLCVLFEGWDASGKGGAIKRLVERARPAARAGRAVRRAHPRREAAPLPVAVLAGAARLGRHGRARPLLVRPGAGRAGRGLRPEEEWRRAYGEIVDFERTLAAEGMILVKFWMHVSPEEQLRRFEARQDDPYKAWKLTDEDWRNREKRPEYEDAVEEMLERTDHPAGRVARRRRRRQAVGAGRRRPHRVRRRSSRRWPPAASTPTRR